MSRTTIGWNSQLCIRTCAQETFDEALWPRHLEYRNTTLAATGSAGKVHILDAEQPPATIFANTLPIVDEWAVGVVAGGHHSASEEKTMLINREMEALHSVSTAAEKTKRRSGQHAKF